MMIVVFAGSLAGAVPLLAQGQESSSDAEARGDSASKSEGEDEAREGERNERSDEEDGKSGASERQRVESVDSKSITGPMEDLPDSVKQAGDSEGGEASMKEAFSGDDKSKGEEGASSSGFTTDSSTFHLEGDLDVLPVPGAEIDVDEESAVEAAKKRHDDLEQCIREGQKADKMTIPDDGEFDVLIRFDPDGSYDGASITGGGPFHQSLQDCLTESFEEFVTFEGNGEDEFFVKFRYEYRLKEK